MSLANHRSESLNASTAAARGGRRRRRSRGLRRSLGALVVGLCLGTFVGSETVDAAPPMGGRPDPRQMSGLSRLDPQVPPGTITVRCLLGGFDQPAVGTEVILEVKAPDGRSETFKANADGQGRATFAGVEGFTGGQAIASVTFDGEIVRSREIPIAASAGSRVMLVKGAPPAGPVGSAAGGSAAGGSAADGSGVDSSGFPAPGRPFSDPRFPKGTLVVGVLDLSLRSGVEGRDITLTIKPPEGEPIVRTGKTDRQGRALFEGLDGEDVPEGSILSVASVIEEGGELQESEEFSIGEEGLALVFTLGSAGEDPSAGANANANAGRAQRRPIMPPRLTPTMKAGSVRVSVIDGMDMPVSQQEVGLTQFDVTGAEVEYDGVSGPDGVAHFEGVKVNIDSAYQVTVNYEGAPYSTSLFRLHESMGALAELRVFKTTNDVTRLRSATQLEIAGRENDLAQVTQLYQVVVSGDEAYWPGEPLKIEGAEGAIGFVVMDRASRIVEHAEKAPFAVLREPIPPGEVVDLSFAYLVEHTGSATIRWAPTMPLLESGVLLPKELTLSSGATSAAIRPPQVPDAPYDYYELGARETGVPIELVIDDLPTRPRIFRDLGLAFGLGILVMLGFSMMSTPRRSRRERLAERRAELIRAIEECNAETGEDPSRERRKMNLAVELDQVLRQLSALEGVDVAKAAKASKAAKPAKPDGSGDTPAGPVA